jgi:hypothetical protein
MEITRRDLIKASAAITVLGTLGRASAAAQDPLPSWNDGPSKKAILDFVRTTTDTSSSKFVPIVDRSATFTKTARFGSNNRSTRR